MSQDWIDTPIEELIRQAEDRLGLPHQYTMLDIITMLALGKEAIKELDRLRDEEGIE